MKYKQLYILVEGPDDKRFFERIIKQKFDRKYKTVRLMLWTNRKKEVIEQFVKSYYERNDDYIFVSDMKGSACISERKLTITKTYTNVSNNNILIVKKDIEGWYLAGLGDITCKKLGITPLKDTDSITKGKFDKLHRGRLGDGLILKLEILKNFSIDAAIRKNSSFKYFMKKYDC